MFEYLRGTIDFKSPSALVLDVHGVGYALDIPASTFDRLPEPGAEARVLVHFYVREDTQRLYGFSSDSERDAFRKLIGISKIGPKVALSILSGLSVKDLAYAVSAQDPSRLKAVSGVGAKTAQRLVVELKGKLNVADAVGVSQKRTGSDTRQVPVTGDREAFGALLALGYGESQVVRALARVRETIAEGAAVEDWIKKALQVI